MGAQIAADAALDREPVTESVTEPVTDRAAERDDRPAAEPFEAFDRGHVDRVYRALAVTLGSTAARTRGDRRGDGPRIRPLAPGAEAGQSGWLGVGLEFPLLVIEPDGSASTLGDLRVMCETVELLAADADNAYLVRDGAKLVAHDLATGEERVLLSSPAALSAEQWRGLAVPHDRLVSVANHDTCSPAVRVTDVSTGITDEHALSEQVGCHGVAARRQP